MAKRTIIVGINQCMMAALSMATIAALINGPGLGQPVTEALQTLDIGNAFVSGIAIVIMAIMLDRTTTAASQRAEHEARTGRSGGRQRRLFLGVSAVAVVVCVYVSRTWTWAAEFPDRPDLGGPLADRVSTFTDWLVGSVENVTNALKDLLTYGLINPLESLLAETPWWLMGLVILALAYLLGGWRPAATSLACLAVILGTGLWNETMKTLTTTVVATIVVVLSALESTSGSGRCSTPCRRSRRSCTWCRHWPCSAPRGSPRLSRRSRSACPSPPSSSLTVSAACRQRPSRRQGRPAPPPGR